MLSRIVSPDAHQNVPNREQTNFREQIYGISDPLTQFTIVLSALIHDVEHQGVTNAVLVNEGIDLAARYNNKSVAEQNSVDRAWEILMQPKYKELQACIFSTQEELARFRSILVNGTSVVAICHA